MVNLQPSSEAQVLGALDVTCLKATYDQMKKDKVHVKNT